MNRRQFLKYSAAAAGVALVGSTGWSIGFDRWSLRLDRVDLPVKGLPAAFDGLRLALLSDFHAGPNAPWWLSRRAVALAMREKPDMIALTGDYVSVSASETAGPLAAMLTPLAAPAGVFAVLGNHDHVLGRSGPVTAGAKKAGATMILNRSVEVRRGGATLWMIGLDDPVTGHDNFRAAMEHVPPGAPSLMLAHTPDIIEPARQLGIGGVLVGHTHGGQVCIPFYGPPIVPSKYGRRYASGLHRLGDTAIYTTRGVGMVPPLVRFLCPPEVALLTLRTAA